MKNGIYHINCASFGSSGRVGLKVHETGRYLALSNAKAKSGLIGNWLRMYTRAKITIYKNKNIVIRFPLDGPKYTIRARLIKIVNTVDETL